MDVEFILFEFYCTCYFINLWNGGEILNYRSEKNEKINGISAASTDAKVTSSPEVEKLTEEILLEAKKLEKHKKKKPKKKKPKRKVAKSVVISVLCIVALFLTVRTVRLINIFDSVNYVSSSDSRISSETDLLVEPSFVQANVSHSDETKNIMLMGCDVDENGVSRTDSMIVLSLDHKNQKIKVTSLMRDMFLRIPGKGRHKLNAAYVYGGPDLLLSTVYSNFGLEINNYICVDYAAFAEIVDCIGGVDIEIKKNELKQFNKYVSGKENQIHEAGTYLMNGKQTLSYCRIRKVGTDTARTARQREVLGKIIEKCRKMSYTEIENLLAVAAPRLTTNLTQGEMLSLIAEGMSCMDYDTLNMRIPVDGTWHGTYIDTTWYMDIDLQENAQYLNDFIYGNDLIAKGLASQLEESDLYNS